MSNKEELINAIKNWINIDTKMKKYKMKQNC